MNKTWIIILIVIGGFVLSGLIFGAGMLAGRTSAGFFGMAPANQATWASCGNNPGCLAPGNNGRRMGQNFMPGRRGMPGWFGNQPAARPLTVEQARQAVEAYLKELNDSDLEIKEIMIFDNNAYARITEKSSGIGAFELLVDPASLAVFPEHGPNMMWNLKYGPMVGSGGFGGMMGGRNGMMAGRNRGFGGRFGMMGSVSKNANPVSADMPVSSEQALQYAQDYLDREFPGTKTAADADPFYGYYTIDILKDGKPTGMLSVNGFNGQVFFHSWHGTFLEISE